MTTYFELIRKRRSIRRFEKRPLPSETVDLLIEAALRAPSSRGLNPWQFVMVTEPDIIAELSRAKPHGASFLKHAPLAIVVLGDETVSDVWIEDTSIAAIYLHLAAEASGLGSCWVQIRKRTHTSEHSAEAFIQDLLAIPAHMKVLCVMAIGYPAEAKSPHPADSLQHDKIHRERWGTP